MPAFAALADDTRMQIIEVLAERDRSVNDLVELFPISQPAVSRHLRVLREAGVVNVERSGQQRIYRLRPEAVTEVAGWAERLIRSWEQRFDSLGQHLNRMEEQRRDR